MKVPALKYIGGFLFFTMTCFIGIYTTYKIPIIILYVFLYFIIYKKGIRISNSTIIIVGAIILFGIIGLVGALVYNNDTFLKYLTTPLLWPFAYIMLISGIKTEIDFKGLTNILIFSHSFIVVYDLIYAGSFLFGYHIPDIYQMEIEAFSLYENQARMNFLNLRTLIFTTPLIFILSIGNFKTYFSKKYLFILLLLTIFLLLISGRRMQMLIVFLLLFVPLFFRKFFSKSVRKSFSIFLAAAILVVIIIYFYLSIRMPDVLQAYWNVFMRAFDPSAEPIRFNQSQLLINAFKERPLFGNGFGMKLWESAKGENSIDFELSYQLRLAWTGLIGFSSIMFAFIYPIFRGLYISQKTDDLLLLTFIIGFIFVLIADATNPYLASFDTLWPLYLLVAKINNYELSKTTFLITPNI